MTVLPPVLQGRTEISNSGLIQIVGLSVSIACLAMAFLYRDLLFIYSAIVGVYVFVIGGAVRPLREEKKESPFKRAKQLLEKDEEP